MFANTAPKHALARQAQTCRGTGSTFVAAVLEAVERQLVHAPITAGMVGDWQADPGASAMALRINGALHALARSGRPRDLSRLYDGEHDDFDGAIAAALAQEDRFIAEWIRYPTQTNEVARGALIMAALMSVAAEHHMPFQIFELGSSGGLNLNPTLYAYRLGDVVAGDPMSNVRIAPQWRGAPPPLAEVTLVEARGVDLNPLNPCSLADRERLQAFTWVDQPARAQRLKAALETTAAHPPHVDRGDALQWLIQRLAEPQAPQVCRAVMHSMFLQYLDSHGRQAIAAAMAAAGARATADQPLIEIGLEWTCERTEVQLRLTSWPGAECTVLATSHPYGDWVNWFGRAGPLSQDA